MSIKSLIKKPQSISVKSPVDEKKLIGNAFGEKQPLRKEFDITDEEELKIWRNFKNLRLEKDKNYLIRKYSPLVKYVAGKIAPTVPASVEFNDLIGFGTFGLLDAVNKFDPDKGVKFKTYGITRIRGQIYDELRSLDWVPRSIRQKYKLIEEVKQNYKEETGQPIKDEAISSQLGMSSEEINRISSMINDSNVGSLDDAWSSKKDADDTPLIETLKAPEHIDPFSCVEEDEIKATIGNEIKKLPEKEKKVLILYYYEELTLKEIGKILQVTESRVSQLHSKAIRHIRASLDGIKKNLI
ncbi:RNA polymerase sigma factor FliA [Spirochaetota bacterium]|nr:RNA polymerase sigma factor FliA [Spirochaetota bacterium]